MKLPFFLTLLACVAAGCAAPRLPELGARYAPANVHALPAISTSIRRVALLPLAPPRAGSLFAAGAETLAAALETELRKTGRFEVVVVTEQELLAWTSRRHWRADEVLPQDFLAQVREATGCDAILFPALTAFQPYPPLAVGLNLRLVDCASLTAVWAVDEVIDAGTESVARSARDYAHSHLHLRAGDEGAILQSPARFARFAAAALLTTLPPLDNLLKKQPVPSITD